MAKQHHYLNWLKIRLSQMSGIEVLYRFYDTLLGFLQRIFSSLSLNKFKYNLPTHEAFWFEPGKEFEPTKYRQAADFILQGLYQVFELQNLELGFPPQWNTNPKSNLKVPLSFGKTLDTRDTHLVGDIKYLWEINRHYELVTLAQAYYLTREQKYMNAIGTMINSWIDSCPYLYGPNWASSLEVAVRVINWSLAWQMIGGLKSPLFAHSDGKKLQEKWIRSIYEHTSYIGLHLSRFSSANNHLIGEISGLFIATLTWPYWTKFKKLNEKAKRMLERESRKQTYHDGVNKEQSFAYQQFVLEFLILSGLVGKFSQNEFSSGYWENIKSMSIFLRSILDINQHIPMVGDSDDGLVIRLDPETTAPLYQSLLTLVSRLFHWEDFSSASNLIDDKPQWLLNAPFDKSVLPISISQNIFKKSFSEGGYYLLGKHFGEEDEIKLMFDAGPLGYLSIAAHGHADALAFYLSVRGHEIFIDPGTFTYYSDKKFRNYFRSTSAHNTVRIDNKDQSTMIGNFIWLQKAQTFLKEYISNDEIDYIKAYHNGYQRLDDPIIHEREIEYEKSTNIFQITDSFHCKGHHTVEFFWHISENNQVKKIHNGIEITAGCNLVTLRCLSKDLAWHIYFGDEKFPLGWVSRAFGQKEACYTAVASTEINGDSNFVFILTCQKNINEFEMRIS